ncbi:MAG: hypothetical protein JHC41_04235 [Nitrosopumilus sp.]|nr:hypothetical protein [Nitrosopumilus sp.]
MAKSSNKQHEQQERSAKSEKEQVEMIEDWINQKNEWDRLKKVKNQS